MPTISGYTLVGATSGATIDAWKASRFGTAPIYDGAPPTGSPDAGPVTAGESFGGAGEWLLTLPTTEPYWIRAQLFGHSAWEFRDLSEAVDVGGTPTTSAVGDAAADGTGLTAAREDHLHGREGFGTPGSSAVGDAAANGTATTVARSDHKHGREAFATPSIALGTAAAAGVATTPIRSDSTIVAFDATAPATQAFGDSAATGSAAVASRRDHKHAMPADPRGLPVGGGLTGAVAATRYVGGTTTGHPTTGTFAVGDYVVTQDASVWVCTVAGTPGTWTQIAGGGGGSSTLAADTDVSIVSPTDGQFIKYQSSDSKWHNVNLMTASGGMLLGEAAVVTANEGTTSATFTGLTTASTITFTVPASGSIVVELGAQINNSTGSMGFAISGTDTLAAADDNAITNASSTQNINIYGRVRVTGLTPGGTDTVTAQYKATTGTCNFTRRRIAVYDGATAINQVGVTAAMNANEAQASVISANAASDHFFGTALASKWAQNIGTVTTSIGDSSLGLSSTSGEGQLLEAFSSASGTALTVDSLITSTVGETDLYLTDGLTPASQNAVMILIQAGSAMVFYTRDAGTFNNRGTGPVIQMGTPVYARLTRSAADLWTAQYSFDRITWRSFTTFTKVMSVAYAGWRQGANPSVGSVDFVDVVDGTVGAQAGLVTALPPASGAGQAVVSGSASPYAPAWAGDTAWTALTLVNSWAAAGSTTPAYRKDALGFVHLKGQVSGGATANSQIATLPVGYRPLEQREYIAGELSDGVSGHVPLVDVNTTGTIVPARQGTGTSIPLDCITFLAEQ